MVQLHVLNGASAGRTISPAQLPLTVGRAAGNTLTLSDPGIFDRHFAVQFTPEGILLQPAGDAAVTVNGIRSEPQTLLRNGDIIGAGYAKIQFWLGALPQRGLKAREIATWSLILIVAAGQAYCCWRLLAMAR